VPEAPSVARRAVLALALAIGFYVLAAIIIALCLGAFCLQFRLGHFSLRLSIGVLLLAGIVLFSILPRRQPFEAPGPLVNAELQPDLFAMLKRLSQRTGEAMPRDVYIVPDVNAFVSNRPGKRGRERIMGIGLPLMQVLTVSELEAVLAHEFGHYYGGDTKLGPWVYSTYNAISRTLESLGGGFTQIPFKLYGNMFMRVSQGVSRQQEYTADAFAARIAGPRPLIAALRKIHGEAPAFQQYWGAYVAPVLQSGHLPPITAGFKSLHSEKLQTQMDEYVDEQMEKDEGDVHDSHPPLRDRIAALEKIDVAIETNDAPAIDLIRQVSVIERVMAGQLFFEVGADDVKTMEWQNVANELFVPRWRETEEAFRHWLGKWTVGSLGKLVAGFEEFGKEMTAQNGAPIGEEYRLAVAQIATQAGLSVALLDDGWRFVMDPSQGQYFEKEDTRIDPPLEALWAGYVGAAAWTDGCDDSKIGHLPLGRSTVPESD
jgi:Zn-dependent protease with chaperone function